MATRKTKFDPMQERVTRFVPRAPAGEPQSIYININGKGFNIPRGKTVSMPVPVSEILTGMMRAEDAVEADIRRHEPSLMV